jgi:hypothetical protein
MMRSRPCVVLDSGRVELEELRENKCGSPIVWAVAGYRPPCVTAILPLAGDTQCSSEPGTAVDIRDGAFVGAWLPRHSVREEPIRSDSQQWTKVALSALGLLIAEYGRAALAADWYNELKAHGCNFLVRAGVLPIDFAGRVFDEVYSEGGRCRAEAG